jgi:predicted kinase
MCGKAGAGKSTLALSLARQHDATLLCEDVWLARLYPEELRDFNDYLVYAKRIQKVVAPLVIDLLSRQSVVLDFPANTVQGRLWYRSLFEQAKVAHTLHHLPASNSLCLSRIAQRNLARPEGSHQLDEATFMTITALFVRPYESEGFHVVQHDRLQVHNAPSTDPPPRQP